MISSLFLVKMHVLLGSPLKLLVRVVVDGLFGFHEGGRVVQGVLDVLRNRHVLCLFIIRTQSVLVKSGMLPGSLVDSGNDFQLEGLLLILGDFIPELCNSIVLNKLFIKSATSDDDRLQPAYSMRNLLSSMEFSLKNSSAV